MTASTAAAGSSISTPPSPPITPSPPTFSSTNSATTFAGLADEYYTSDVAYGSSSDRPEPWEPNATADPHAAKWKELLTGGIELPTLWPKKEFETSQQDIQARRRAIRAQGRPEEEMEALFREERAGETKLLGSGPNAGKVGALRRRHVRVPAATTARSRTASCSHRDEVGFCAVCRRAIERIIAMYAR